MKAIIIITVFILMGIGCNSSKITTSWKAPASTLEKDNKILVLGFIQETDKAMQQKMENHFVADLHDLGYNAVSAYREYGPKVFDKMDEASAVRSLKNSGVDIILTIVLLDKKKEQKYINGSVQYLPQAFYYKRFWDYRERTYNRIYEPGYYVTHTKYFWESNLYDTRTQKLVYSVQTQSFDPSNTETMAHHYGLLIVNDMVKQKVIMRKEINETDAN